MMGLGPQCYIPKFMEIGPLVPENKICKGFYHIWALRPSWLRDQYHINTFSFLCTLKVYIQHLVKIGKWFLRKFLFSYVNEFGPWSRNDLDL